MLDAPNPFAPPRASLDPASAEGIWRDGRILVLRPGSPMPPRCIKCNAPAALPLRPRKLYWHPPWIYLLLLLNILIYVIAALVGRKHAVVAAGLCSVHRTRHRLILAAGWGGALLGLCLMVYGAAQGYCFLGVAGAVVFLAAIVLGFVLSRVVFPQRIDSDYIRLKGCGQAFLDGFPEFHG